MAQCDLLNDGNSGKVSSSNSGGIGDVEGYAARVVKLFIDDGKLDDKNWTELGVKGDERVNDIFKGGFISAEAEPVVRDVFKSKFKSEGDLEKFVSLLKGQYGYHIGWERARKIGNETKWNTWQSNNHSREERLDMLKDLKSMGTAATPAFKSLLDIVGNSYEDSELRYEAMDIIEGSILSQLRYMNLGKCAKEAPICYGDLFQKAYNLFSVLKKKREEDSGIKIRAAWVFASMSALNWPEGQ